MDVYVIQILSQEEIDPEVTGDLKLVDVEDDDVAEITVSSVLMQRYAENLAACGCAALPRLGSPSGRRLSHRASER